jgi:hypothetical protein
VNTLIVSQEHDQKTLSAAVGTQVHVRLPVAMQWSDIEVQGDDGAKPVLRRLAGTASQEGTNAVFVADQPGTVSLSAHGRAKPSPGQAAPHFMIAWHTTIVVK